MKKSPLHQYQSFLDPRIPRGASTAFVEMAYDFASGLGVALELIHSSNVDQVAHEANPSNFPPILSYVDAEKLMRFAVAASHMLADAAYEHIEKLNDMAHQEAQA